jgi:hypothetical protein
MLGSETIKDALADVRTRTQGVEVGAEVWTGKDSTNDDAVWVYVVVPDERIEAFYEEWPSVRDEIRTRRLEETTRPLAAKRGAASLRCPSEEAGVGWPRPDYIGLSHAQRPRSKRAVSGSAATGCTASPASRFGNAGRAPRR